MKMRHKIIILFTVLFVYVLALILVPVVAKKMNKNDKKYGRIIYSENKVDDNTLDNIYSNRFIMYVDYESDKLDCYKRYSELEYNIYLSIYTLTDFDNYNEELFKGVFIKNNNEELISFAKEKNYKIRLLTNNSSDYDKYKKDVEEFTFSKDIINEMSSKYKNKFFYTYIETTTDDYKESEIKYYKELRETPNKYGLVIYVVK